MSIKNLPKPTAAQYRWQDMSWASSVTLESIHSAISEWGDGRSS